MHHNKHQTPAGAPFWPTPLPNSAASKPLQGALFAKIRTKPRRQERELVRTWFAPGSQLVRSWFAPGSHLVRSWFAPGSHLVRTCFLGIWHLGRGCLFITTRMEEEEEEEEEEAQTFSDGRSITVMSKRHVPEKKGRPGRVGLG